MHSAIDATLSAMNVRTLRTGEWPIWRELRLDALSDSPNSFRTLLEDDTERSAESWADMVDSTVEHPRGGLWIAEIEHEPVGMLFARTDADDSVVEIGAMWVRPTSRDKGVGTALLSAAIEWGGSRGALHAELWVTETNTVAESLYERNGFRPTSDTQSLRPGSSLTVRKMRAAI